MDQSVIKVNYLLLHFTFCRKNATFDIPNQTIFKEINKIIINNQFNDKKCFTNCKGRL